MGIGKCELFQNLLPFIRQNRIRSMCMIGKQTIIPEEDVVLQNLKKLLPDIYERICYSPTQTDEASKNLTEDSVSFFRRIGIKDVHAVDCSDYEGADIIADLNAEASIPEEYRERFELVYDGGTLQCLIDQAQALRNLSSLAKKGGYLWHSVPAFGYADDFFLSYSPHFFIDYYARERGYELCSLYYVVYKLGQDPYMSPDCRLLEGRWGAFLVKHSEENVHIHLNVIAKKVETGNTNVPLLRKYRRMLNQ